MRSLLSTIEAHSYPYDQIDERNKQNNYLEPGYDERCTRAGQYKAIGLQTHWCYSGSENNSNNTYPDDSAYNTGVSSYNSVESSYSRQNKSSNLTPGIQWQHSYHNQAKPPQKYSQSVGCFSPDLDHLQYADDIDDSDSDTATETDTELSNHFSHCYINNCDMSYLPSYIKPVASSPTPTTTSTTTSVSVIKCRSVTSNSPTFVTTTSPSHSNREQYASSNYSPLSPVANNYRKSDKTGSYVGYRETYVRKQQNKLCGRRSLDDRLKSLESGAAVKLEVRRGSQQRRKITNFNPNNEKNKEPSPLICNIKSNVPEQPVAYYEEQQEPKLSPAPPPDIIESHQPKHGTHQISDEENDDARYKGDIRLKFVDSNPKSYQIPETTSKLNSPVTTPRSSTSLEPVETSSPKVELTGSDWKSDRQRKKQARAERQTAKQRERESRSAVDNDEKNKTTVVTPSQLKEERCVQGNKKIEWKELTSDAYTSCNINQTSDLNETITTSSPTVEVVSGRGKPINRAGAPPSLTFSTNETSSVPVELRSPRAENGGISRTNMRERRNARMFILPSSDDSEPDNVLGRFNRPLQNRSLEVVAPVKFVPSMLRKQTTSNKSKTIDNITSSSASGNESRSISRESKTHQQGKQDQQSYKTPRSTKRPKRSSSRSKSHGRSNITSTSEDSSAALYNDKRTARSNSPAHHKKEKHERRSSDAKSEPSPRQPRHKRFTEYAELSNVKRTPKTKRNMEAMNLPSPRQQAVARAVKFGYPTDEASIPYIDEKTSPTEQQEQDSKMHSHQENADPETCKRMLPLSSGSRRGRSGYKKVQSAHRISYIEAMESSDDVTPDRDTDGSMCNVSDVTLDTDNNIANRGKIGRSTSADSILSTVENTVNVVLREQKRSSSADRNSLKGVHRRSYQIATTANIPPIDNLLRTPSHKRQPSIRKLKNFFGEADKKTPQIVEAQADEGRRGSRARSFLLPPCLDITEDDGNILREGFLCFKVATIEKGRRTSSQKSWKSVWAILKDQSLYLCKDWSRTKQDPSVVGGSGYPSPGGNQPPTHFQLEEEEPLNIQGSLVSIAYNYVKRKNVFKVTTGSGSEYLLQAEDRDDMLAWINSIHLSGNHDNDDGEVTINEDLILRKTNQIESGPKPEKRATRKSRSPKPARRMTVPTKDMDGSRRFKWRGSVNRIVRKFGQGQTIHGGTFEVHLEDCPPSPNNEFVPFVVDLCCRIVEERGLTFTGIYRVPGNSGTLAALQDELNLRGPDALDLENDERFCELNVVSSLLKSFFRKLPDPLFTNELYDDFITMNRKKDPEERLNGLRHLVHMLPAPHYQTLKFLISHLRRVADNCDVNKMEVRNLAIVFGPTLVRSTISDNMATMVTDMSDQCRIVESVLQHAAWMFTENEAGEIEVTAPEEKEHEPVPNINHLLANVGRTPGDAGDSASDSSKSKNSLASEKESFSRDVMDMIFGPGKKWRNQQINAKRVSSESDDEFGFKEAQRKLARASELSKSESDSTSHASTPQLSAASSKYQVSTPAAAHLHPDWTSTEKHFPPDIPSRLHDFYVEHLERLARTDVTRHLPNFSSSSTDTSPQVTPRSSLFDLPKPVSKTPSIRPIPSMNQPTRLDQPYMDSKHSIATSCPAHLHHMPRLYGDVQTEKITRDHFKPTPSTSTPVRQIGGEKTQSNSHIESEVSSITKCEDSDSDTSVYVGETLEEKLRNLTNLNKKLERRPSKRYARTSLEPEKIFDMQPKLVPTSKQVSKRLTGPSLKAGELITPSNVHIHAPKKSTRELYQERKTQRQYNRDMIRANRGKNAKSRYDEYNNTNLIRCVSDENVFSRFDPKRQVVRPANMETTVSSKSSRPRRSSEQIRRRHTLGASDFPDQDFWRKQKEAHSSLQNVSRDGMGSATSRLNPKPTGKPLQMKSTRPAVMSVTWKPRSTPTTRRNESYL
uniref:rho GTPase-activating protein 21 isoform X4 n=1 Tax=Ciona intestinalis TaxID=7719 RepID=UPI000EF4CD9C|nr:rho GTPase-activating protein 21 isoform X4 [Ciona intestinalis]|eukprot:XP_026690538.1 rho GTPase-activating protein 21 isoform X4 [Ciona intestinalis]